MAKETMAERRLKSIKELIEHLETNYKYHAETLRAGGDNIDDITNSTLFLIDYEKLINKLYDVCEEDSEQTGIPFERVKF